MNNLSPRLQALYNVMNGWGKPDTPKSEAQLTEIADYHKGKTKAKRVVVAPGFVKGSDAYEHVIALGLEPHEILPIDYKEPKRDLHDPSPVPIARYDFSNEQLAAMIPIFDGCKRRDLKLKNVAKRNSENNYREVLATDGKQAMFWCDRGL